MGSNVVEEAGRRYLAPDWEEFYSMMLDLAARVRGSGFKVDVIVAISRGGWIPGRLLSDLMPGVFAVSMKVENYDGFVNVREKPVLTQPLSIDLTGKRVLLVDDIVDTGASLQLAIDHVKSRGALEVQTLAVYYKPRSTIKPDFHTHETAEWVIFPWERMEATRLMQEQLGDESKVRAALSKLKIDRKSIELLLGMSKTA